MIYTGLVILHVIVALALILIVLLQTGKGGSIGAAFGGGASETVFGSRGAGGFLSKLTTAAAIIFMLTSLTLAVYSSRHEGSVVLEQRGAPAQPSAPGEGTPKREEGGTVNPPANPPAEQEAAPGAETQQTTN